jgi:eukaryotic-like serine/threonine-protein kinase
MNPGDLLCNRYQIEKALAAGSFGETYLAIDLHLPSKPQVVVKHLKPLNNDPATLQNAQRLFESEAKVLEELGKKSDRIPTLYTYFEDKIEKRINRMIERHSEFYLVQEFIEGQTLTAELQSAGGKLSESQVIEILQEILAGLQEVHQKDKIHRDLKPDNIMRRAQDGKLVLIDFGAVKEIRRISGTGNTVASATVRAGSEGYMSMEQAMGFPRLASDVYAVGAIGIQCLTGTHPSKLFDEAALALRWQHLCQVSSGLATVLEKMVVQNANDRYRDAKDAAGAIASLVKSVSEPQLTKIQFTSVKLDSYGKIVDRPTGQAEIFTEDLGNGVSLSMVKIPSGKFMMGQTVSEKQELLKRFKEEYKDYFASELPQHQVTVSEFFLGQMLVTQAQWQAIMGNNPSKFQGDDRLPVDSVSWLDAMDFCQKLSQKTRRIYRLPSEAEWEYACRAGTTTPFAFGETITPVVVNYDGIFTYAKAAEGESHQRATVVGSFPANLFGLYDMHGNLWEWCLDEWSDNYNNVSTDGSPEGDITSKVSSKAHAVMRGGSWYDLRVYCRSAYRISYDADLHRFNGGFRIVYSPART